MADAANKVYVGYDSREDIAWQVCRHSIERNAGKAIDVFPLKQTTLRELGLYTRPFDALSSTEFSLTRFLTPYIAAHHGWTLFMDCDILLTADLNAIFADLDPRKALYVVQHDYTPANMVKMDGKAQSVYPRKNWSSVMIFNGANEHVRALTPTVVNTAEPSYLHRFSWLPDDDLIGSLDLDWNFLEGEYARPAATPRAIHFTNGGPWFERWQSVDYADLWRAEEERYLPPSTQWRGNEAMATLYDRTLHVEGHQFRRGLAVQLRVLKALLTRELHSRYGRDNIGFLWLIAEPLMLATVITIVHFSRHMAPKHGISVIPFTILGYTLFIIFRGIFNRADGAVDADHALLHHKMVTIFDFMIVKAILEVAACMVVLCLLLGLAIAGGVADWPYRPLNVIAAYLYMGWFSFAMGLIAASISYHNESIARLLHPVSYFMIPVSGAWWMISWLPPWAQAYFAWWPMALIFEQARYGLFREASPKFVATGYVTFVCSSLLFIGLLMIRRLRSRVHVS